MTHPDEGNEVGIDYQCTLCGDCGWLVTPSRIPMQPSTSCTCICPTGRQLAKDLEAAGFRHADHAQPARLDGI